MEAEILVALLAISTWNSACAIICPGNRYESALCGSRNVYGVNFRAGRFAFIGSNCKFGDNFIAEMGAHIGDRVHVGDNVHIQEFGCVPDDAVLASGLVVEAFSTVKTVEDGSVKTGEKFVLQNGKCVKEAMCSSISDPTARCGSKNTYGKEFRAGLSAVIGSNCAFGDNFTAERGAQIGDGVQTERNVHIKEFGCVPDNAVLVSGVVVEAHGRVKSKGDRYVTEHPRTGEKFVLENGECMPRENIAETQSAEEVMCPGTSDSTAQCGMGNKYGINFRAGRFAFVGSKCEFGDNFTAEKGAHIGDGVRAEDKIHIEEFGCVPDNAVLASGLVVEAYGRVKSEGDSFVTEPPDMGKKFVLENGQCVSRENIEESYSVKEGMCPIMSDSTARCGSGNKYGIEFRAGRNAKIGSRCELGKNFNTGEGAEVGNGVKAGDNVVIQEFGCVPDGAELSDFFIVPKFGTVKRVKAVFEPELPKKKSTYFILENGRCVSRDIPKNVIL